MSSITSCEGFLAVPGGKIWYRILGKERENKPLIIIHGGPGSSHDYLEKLSELEYNGPIIFYDQLGCGKSDRPKDVSLWVLDRFIEELHELMELLSEMIESAKKGYFLLGHSWGGTLAVSYYSRYPENIAGLILSAPLICSGTWEKDQMSYLKDLPTEMQEAIKVAENLASESDTDSYGTKEYQEAVMEFYRRHLCRMNTWPEELNRSFELMNAEQYQYMWGPSEFTITGNLKRFDCSQMLHKIKIPVLLTCGRFDESTPESLSVYKDIIPDCQLNILEDSSHNHHLEKPEEYKDSLLKFIFQRKFVL